MVFLAVAALVNSFIYTPVAGRFQMEAAAAHMYFSLAMASSRPSI
jgi:hypothetical protein